MVPSLKYVDCCHAKIDRIMCGKPIVYWWFGKNTITKESWLTGFCEEHKLFEMLEINGTCSWKQITSEEATARYIMET